MAQRSVAGHDKHWQSEEILDKLEAHTVRRPIGRLLHGIGKNSHGGVVSYFGLIRQ
jgi:hypothetical protein